MVGGLNAGISSANNNQNTRGTTAEEFKSRRDSAKKLSELSKEVSKAAAERRDAKMAAGQQGVAQGTNQTLQGGVSLGLGTVQLTAGIIMMGNWSDLGVTKAPAMAMMIAGLGQIAQGTMQMAAGNANIAEGTSKLADAAREGVITKEQASVANKEMIRSQIYDTKAQMIEETVNSLKNEGILKGAEGMDLSPEQLEKLRAMGQEAAQHPEKVTEMFNKAFAAGGEAIKDGGILTMKFGEENRYFTEDKEGAIHEVNVKLDAEGNPLRDEYGALQLDLENPEVSAKAELSDDQIMEVIFNMAVMNQMENMITGGTDEAGNVLPPLARIAIDPESGEASKEDFDIKNPLHRKEFAELVKAADAEPKPLKFFDETDATGSKVLYFQKWDWETNTGIGEKVSIDEMSGGKIDKSQKDWKEKAKATANAAFEKVGLGKESDAYKLLQPLAAESAENDRKLPTLEEFKGLIGDLRASTVRSNRSSSSSNTPYSSSANSPYSSNALAAG